MTRWLVAILLMLSGVSMAKADALHQRRLAWHRCAPAKSGRFKAGLRDLNEGAFLLHLRAGGVRHQRRTRQYGGLSQPPRHRRQQHFIGTPAA